MRVPYLVLAALGAMGCGSAVAGEPEPTRGPDPAGTECDPVATASLLGSSSSSEMSSPPPSVPSSLAAAYAALERGPSDLGPRLAVADRQLACLREPLSPALAASAHRAHALAAWLGRDRARVLGAWAAATRLEPEWRPSSDVVPEGHPLDQLLAQARSASPATPEPVTLPAGDALLVDGAPRTSLPTDAPAVVQITRRGEIWATTYRWPGEPLPPLPPSRTSVVVPRAAWVSAGAGAVASGVLWGLALRDLADYRARVRAPSLDADERAAAVTVGERANLLGGIATGTSALTAGALTVGLLTTW